MYCITDQQIDYILNDIRRNGIETEDLQFNLLDHICCMAEHKLKDGDDFELFYKTAIQQFYKKELREIEEETVRLLTFKNYFMLKKIMIGSGAISVFAFLTGSFFKVMHWPGAAVMLTLGILLLSFMFLPLVFILKAKEVNSGLEKLVVAMGTVLGILFCLDILFTVQHWPGGRVLWFSTIIVSLFIFIPLFFFSGVRKAETRTNTILTTIMLVGFTGLLFTAINLRPSPRLYENGLSSYLQNEAILSSMQQSPVFQRTGSDATLEGIMETSAQLKSAILQYATGKSSLPGNTNAATLKFRQESLSYMDGYFKPTGMGIKLMEQLQHAVQAYNKTHGQTIPAALALVQDSPEQIGTYDNLYMLNSLTQLQIYMATSVAGHKTETVAQR